ncbi:MAG: helix-turn-helix transcriptional regulator [Actinomycetaceae bacterium]|nr:helix-turn-helix transcriptional regulator [Actinomycetaceae bacterium]
MARPSGYTNGELPDAALNILLALLEPRHGYAIMQFLDDESRGNVVIGPASLYTTLKKLVASGYISEVETEGNRRIYHITALGSETLLENIEYRRQLLQMAERIMEKS